MEALLNPALLAFLRDGGGPALVVLIVGYALWREVKRDRPPLPPPTDDVAKALIEMRIDLAGRLAKIETRLDGLEKRHD